MNWTQYIMSSKTSKKNLKKQFKKLKITVKNNVTLHLQFFLFLDVIDDCTEKDSDSLWMLTVSANWILIENAAHEASQLNDMKSSLWASKILKTLLFNCLKLLISVNIYIEKKKIDNTVQILSMWEDLNMRMIWIDVITQTKNWTVKQSCTVQLNTIQTILTFKKHNQNDILEFLCDQYKEQNQKFCNTLNLKYYYH